MNYNYVMIDAGQELHVSCSAPPDQVVDLLSTFAKMLGYRWDELPIVLYVRPTGSGVWKLIRGATDPDLFTLPTKGIGVLQEDDYYRIGRKVLDSYVVMHNWVKELSLFEKHCMNEETKLMLADFKQKMFEIESVIYGTDMEQLFCLKYQQGEKNYVIAAELNVSLRTLDRRIRAMTIRIGKTLHAMLTPRRLQEIMQIVHTTAQNIS
ncbi:MAG: hypothetical protein K6T63_03065 [Alicyclobacillus herbarius]|uniref:hypothetical protein n=1 Tax=Alicyclobacillus herbarius TaxID=122960 RepID=UPI002355AA91|nr:hypothetical protein [Alicyclobacillus herbarius]MCL6631587.1 hypothetical protein [Alicyclobacillus herbarius]